jgi:hypothetical protein
VRTLRFDDPPCMPGTAEHPAARFSRALPLVGTPGQAYVERRGVPLEIAETEGVRFDPNFNGRPAVTVALRDRADLLTSVHGRYLQVVRGQNKMLTIGQAGGAISVRGGWRAEPLILVEGLFDALSLATCGWPAVATIGRWAPWLRDVSAQRVVWLGFDASRPGAGDVARYAQRLYDADVRRLLLPPGCKDWSTALVKRGRRALGYWIGDALGASETLYR